MASRGRSRPRARVCDKPGCDRPGKFRAPRSPDQLDEFLWFCLDHVREYNLKWNFFESHSDAELERQFAADRVWGRPTRPFREAAAAAAPSRTPRGAPGSASASTTRWSCSATRRR